MVKLRGCFRACVLACLLTAFASAARAYTLEFMDKWGPPYYPSGCVGSSGGGPSAATISWSYIVDGAGFSTAQTTPPFVAGSTSNLYTGLRAAIDAQYGAGAFDRAVNNAFVAWASVANLTFQRTSDSSALFAGTTAIDIRIGAYPFSGGSDVGGVGYGPPCNAPSFPDALAGDIAFSSGNSFQIAAGNDGDPLPLINGMYYNDIESLMLHEIGHAIGLGHSTDPSAVMCGYVDANHDGSQCYAQGASYEVIHRKLQPDDIAGAQFLYGAPAAAADAPMPLWSNIALGLSLLGIAVARAQRKRAIG